MYIFIRLTWAENTIRIHKKANSKYAQEHLNSAFNAQKLRRCTNSVLSLTSLNYCRSTIITNITPRHTQVTIHICKGTSCAHLVHISSIQGVAKNDPTPKMRLLNNAWKLLRQLLYAEICQLIGCFFSEVTLYIRKWNNARL